MCSLWTEKDALRHKISLFYTLRSLCKHTVEFRKFDRSKWSARLKDASSKEIRIKQNAFYSGRFFAFVKCVYSNCPLLNIFTFILKSFKIKKQFSFNMDENESKVEHYSLTGRVNYFSSTY